MRKIIFFMVGIICFSTLVAASLYNDFWSYSYYKVNLTDYGKSNFSAFESRYATNGYSYYNIVLDYGEFENATAVAVGKSTENYYGEIKVVDSIVYVLGYNLSALTEVVNLLTNFESHTAVLRDNYAIWFDDTYFRMHELGYNLVPYDYNDPYKNCYDAVSYSRYQNNSGTYGSLSTPFSSVCTSDGELYYPHCSNGVFTVSYEYCKCSENKCIGTITDIFNLIATYDSMGETTQIARDIKYATSTWINS
jgi:hypothetical protein